MTPVVKARTARRGAKNFIVMFLLDEKGMRFNAGPRRERDEGFVNEDGDTYLCRWIWSEELVNDCSEA